MNTKPIAALTTCHEQCPFLKEYEHPFFVHTAWCEYMETELDYIDTWVAACKRN